MKASLIQDPTKLLKKLYLENKCTKPITMVRIALPIAKLKNFEVNKVNLESVLKTCSVGLEGKTFI